MEITPLVRHAAMHLPALTDLFSDQLPATHLTVRQPGEMSVIVCGEPHNIPVGTRTGICISKMDVPNRITAVFDAAGEPWHYHFITGYPHDAHQGQMVRLAGFTDARMNGQLEVYDVGSDLEFEVVRDGVPVPVLNGSEVLLESLDRGITGWHVVTATSETELEFATPGSVSHPFEIENPVILSNIRIWGSLTYEGARNAYIRVTEGGQAKIMSEKPGLFIVPNPLISMAKSKDAGIGITQEVNSGTDFRARLLDEVDIFAFFPVTGHNDVEVADIVQGQLLAAMLKTFYGLKLPRPELSACPEEHMMMVFNRHRAIEHNGAVYVHGYEFQAPALVRNDDVISADQYPDFAPEGDSLQPVGTRALRGIDFDLDAPGVPLTAKISLE